MTVFGTEPQARAQTDLSRVLYDYRKSGLELFCIYDGADAPKELTVTKQSFADEFASRFKVIMGLKRNSTGGFGGRIPEPEEHSGSGGGYYRIG